MTKKCQKWSDTVLKKGPVHSYQQENQCSSSNDNDNDDNGDDDDNHDDFNKLLLNI